MKKIFILGLGSQKSGTTWVSNQLELCPSFQPGLTKEYHVLDKYHAQKRRNLRDLGSKQLQLAAMRLSIETYADHFNSLFHRLPSTTHVADITPSYSLCNVNILKEAKKQITERGFSIKVFFHMRDPAMRLWSQVKMMNKIHKMGLNKNDEIDYFQRFSNSEAAKRRSDYPTIIRNINSIFNPEEVRIDFYENMFTQEFATSFSDFIELDDFVDCNLGQKINATNSNEAYGKTLLSAIKSVRNNYSHIIEAIQTMYPTSLPSNWLD